jgi:peptidoglycan DL-endopeptidase CwlO
VRHTRVVVQSAHPKTSGNLYVPSTGRIAIGTDATLLASGLGSAQNNPNNPFLRAGLVGECTWYAWEMRPDLGNHEVRNAMYWYADAQKVGIPTGTAPTPGAIAVFSAWQAGAGSYGHVAYVESVNGGSMTISEYNVQGFHRGPTHRALAWNGVHFVYGGPAGNGPTSTPAPAPAPGPGPGPANRVGITS